MTGPLNSKQDPSAQTCLNKVANPRPKRREMKKRPVGVFNRFVSNMPFYVLQIDFKGPMLGLIELVFSILNWNL